MYHSGLSLHTLAGASRALLVISLVVLSLACTYVPSSEAVGVDFQKAMTFPAWGVGVFQSERANRALASLVGMGVNFVVAQTIWYMDTGASTTIYADPTSTPSDESVSYIIQQIHGYGLKAGLKIQIDLKDDSIRKKFSPANWDAWWQSYRAFVLRYARLAQNAGAEILVLGTELDPAVPFEARWRQLISDARTIYKGDLSYGASRITCLENSGCAPGYRVVSWWDALDYAGIDAWFPLTNINNPTLAQLLDAWKPWVADLEDWQLHIGKPVLFTEMGYSSYDGTNRRPPTMWNGEPLDFQEQVDTYEAAFQTFFDKPWLHGIYWWYWALDPDAGGMSEGTWIVQNKPAQQTVATWFAKTWPARQASFVPCPGLRSQLIQPKDGAGISSVNGVTLKVLVLDNLARAASVKVTFYVNDKAIGATQTDEQGYAKLSYSPLSGTFSWYVSAEKPDYRTGISETRTVRYTAVLRVNLLAPKDGATTANPVTLKVRILYGGLGVTGVAVIFKVDGTSVGSATTDSNGYAMISASLGSGNHQWYVTASGTGYATTSSSTRSFKVA